MGPRSSERGRRVRLARDWDADPFGSELAKGPGHYDATHCDQDYADGLDCFRPWGCAWLPVGQGIGQQHHPASLNGQREDGGAQGGGPPWHGDGAGGLGARTYGGRSLLATAKSKAYSASCSGVIFAVGFTCLILVRTLLPGLSGGQNAGSLRVPRRRRHRASRRAWDPPTAGLERPRAGLSHATSPRAASDPPTASPPVVRLDLLSDGTNLVCHASSGAATGAVGCPPSPALAEIDSSNWASQAR